MTKRQDPSRSGRKVSSDRIHVDSTGGKTKRTKARPVPPIKPVPPVKPGAPSHRAEYLGPVKRRPLVLDAALGLFAEGGFADASMEELAKRAGTTKPVLYDCFAGGKEEIYFSLLDREETLFRAHMTGVLASTGRMRLHDALSTGLSAFLDYADVNPNGFRVLFGPSGTADPGIVERGQRVREEIISTITSRSMLLAEPAKTPALIVELYNRAIIAVAEEIARWWLASRPLDREVLVSATVTWMMRGFQGIVPKEYLEAPNFGPRTPNR